MEKRGQKGSEEGFLEHFKGFLENVFLSSKSSKSLMKHLAHKKSRVKIFFFNFGLIWQVAFQLEYST